VAVERPEVLEIVVAGQWVEPELEQSHGGGIVLAPREFRRVANPTRVA
jgi:hypothetical protein